MLQTLDAALPLLTAIDNAAATQKPAPEKWSNKEVIGHLIDSACNNHQKFLRTMQAESHLNFIGYDQDFWVMTQQYNQRDWSELINLWKSYNQHLAHLMMQIPDEALSKTISIQDGDKIDLAFLIADYVAHLKHHLRQILH
ncbi:MAG: DinB family protein [Saprospiraceae bacterium]|nr:DinB family protein [Saprospiraceae bacterium]